jgi:Arc/MetJ-type ribon-helix-helix transcriptional regulator
MVQKITITLDRETVAELDYWVQEGKFSNRSRALQSAVYLLAEHQKCARLARELAKLDRKAEQRMADEGFGAEGKPLPHSRGSELVY